MDGEAPLELVILGSGSCIPVRTRRQASVLVRRGDDHVLLDCGNGAVIGMTEAGASPYHLDHIVLSHLHPDHTSDLVTFLAAMNFEPRAPRTAPLHLYGHPGLGAFLDRLCIPWPFLKPEQYELLVEETTSQPRTAGGLTLTPRPVEHSEFSLAWRISCPGRSFVYSGDTRPCPALVDLSRHADLLVCECSYPEGTETEHHMTPSRAASVAREAGVGRLVLTHLYPMTEATDVKGIAERHFDGEVLVAHDMMRLTL